MRKGRKPENPRNSPWPPNQPGSEDGPNSGPSNFQYGARPQRTPSDPMQGLGSGTGRPNSNLGPSGHIRSGPSQPPARPFYQGARPSYPRSGGTLPQQGPFDARRGQVPFPGHNLPSIGRPIPRVGSGPLQNEPRKESVVETSSLKSPYEELTNCLASASQKTNSQEARTKSLQQFVTLLKSQSGSEAACKDTKTLWQKVLVLLSDAVPNVRQSAATGLGCIGAIASKNSSSDLPQSILFDWSLSILDGKTKNSDLSSQFWALTALREGMAIMDTSFLKPWAAAVFSMCENLLDSENTPPTLLPPLLGVASQAARHETAIKARVRILTDILLGWALDPSIPDSARSNISGTIVSFQKGWPSELKFTADLVSNLLNDMEKQISESSSKVLTTPKMLLGFSTCISAICRACAEANKQIYTGFPKDFERAVKGLKSLLTIESGLQISEMGQTVTYQSESCMHVDILMTIAAHVDKSQWATFPQIEDSLEETESGNTESSEKEVRKPVLSSLHGIVLDFILQMLSDPTLTLNGLQAILQLHIRLINICKQRHISPEITILAKLLTEKSPFMVLRLHPNPVIQRIAGQTLMLLLEVEACSDLVIEAMRKPLEEFHLKDPQGLGNSETDDQNMSESKIRNQSSEIGDAPPGLHKETEIIPFNEDEFERNFTVKILAHALEKGNSHVKAKTWVVLWNALLQGLHSPSSQILLNLVKQQSQHSPYANDDLVLGLCQSSTSSQPHVSIKTDLILWIQELMSQSLDKSDKTDESAASDKEKEEIPQLNAGRVGMQWLIHSTQNKEEKVRKTALIALRNLLTQKPELFTPKISKELVMLACSFVNDLDLDVRKQWRDLLILLSQSKDIPEEPFLSNMWEPKLFKASKAITPVSGNNTKPEQALELVEFLATGTVLQRSSSNQHFDFEKWTRNVANRPQTSQREAKSRTLWALLIVREASLSLVESRLRTQDQNPTQVFAFLEKCLQKSFQSACQGQRGNLEEQYWSSWLLLEFFFCLEQNIHHAYEGSIDKEPFLAPVITFFSGNRKTCEDWFSRIRPILLRLASACDHHSAVIAHSQSRLKDLKRQTHNLVSEIQSMEASQEQALRSSEESSDSNPKALLRRPERKDSGLEKDRILSATQKLIHDVNSTMQKALKSLIQKSDGASARGLYSYGTQKLTHLQPLLERERSQATSLNDLFSWMSPIPNQAEGKYEAAAKQYGDILDRMKNGHHYMTNESSSYFSQFACQAYSQIMDWAGMESFIEQTKTLSQTNPGLHLPSATANQYFALMSFDRKEFEIAKGLLEMSEWSLEEETKTSKQLGQQISSMLNGSLAQLLLQKSEEHPWASSGEMSTNLASEGTFIQLCTSELSGIEMVSQALNKLEIVQRLNLIGKAFTSPQNEEISNAEDLMQLGCLSSSKLLSEGNFDQSNMEDASWKARLLSIEGGDSSKALKATNSLIKMSQQAISLGNLNFGQSLLDKAKLTANLSDSKIQGRLAISEAQVSLALGIKSNAKEKILSFLQTNFEGPSDSEISRAYLMLSQFRGSFEGNVGIGFVPKRAEIPENPAFINTFSSEEQEAWNCIDMAKHLNPKDGLAHAAAANWLHDRIEELKEREEEIDSGLVSCAIKASAKRLSCSAQTDNCGNKMPHYGNTLDLATPELLRIINGMKDFPELSELENLHEIPVRFWKSVVPQLVSLLASSQEDISGFASKILLKLEAISPETVLYAILAESDTEGSPYSKLKAALEEKDPVRVCQMENMLVKLKGMTVLCNEEWLSFMHELQANVAKRVAIVEEENKRSLPHNDLADSERQRIFSDRFVAIMAPAAIQLSQAIEKWNDLPGKSVYDHQFDKSHMSGIRSLLNAMKSPSQKDASNPASFTAKIKGVVKSIQISLRTSKLHFSDVAQNLDTDDIYEVPLPARIGSQMPPHLENFSNFQHAQISGSGTLKFVSFKPQIQVLGTRTRPKKLGIVASDGQNFTFLLKGLEDLRLDQRLMQFQLYVSTLMNHSMRNCLRLQGFNVTPISHRAGLIEWVDKTKPLYEVYTDWQKNSTDRVTLFAQDQARKGGPPPSNKVTKLLKPVDTFYARLLPALEAAGVDKLSSRSSWPIEVLKGVLINLSRETPKEMLERQIWAGSICLEDYYARQKQHANSLAITSILGYLIGLGDRHLENMLIDKESAEILHIDYNIVFEQGRRLPVPELVPFRMTRIIQGALGICGLDGQFKSSCIEMLENLRQNRQAVLLVMDAIVNDPLLDWSPRQKDRLANQAMEVGVHLNLICSRIDELSPGLSNFVTEIESNLSTAHSPWSDFVRSFTVIVKNAEIASEAQSEGLESQEAFENIRGRLQAEWEQAQEAARERSEHLGAIDRSREQMQRVSLELRKSYEGAIETIFENFLSSSLETSGDQLLFSKCTAPLGLVEAVPNQSEALLSTFLSQHPQADVDFSTSLLEDLQIMDQQMISCLIERDQAIFGCYKAISDHLQLIQELFSEEYWQESNLKKWSSLLNHTSSASSSQEASNFLAIIPKQENSQVALSATWEAMRFAKGIWHSQSLPGVTHSDTPLAILRADSQARQQNLGKLQSFENHDLHTGFISVFSELQTELHKFPETMLWAEQVQICLKISLQANAYIQAFTSLPDPKRNAAKEMKKSFQALVDVFSGLKLVKDIATYVFLPELQGFQHALNGQDLKDFGSAYFYLQKDAQILTQEANGLNETEEAQQNDINGKRAPFQKRCQELADKFVKILEGKGKMRLPMLEEESIIFYSQSHSSWDGLLESITSFLAIFWKLRAPLDIAYNVKINKSSSNSFNRHDFILTCVQLAHDLTSVILRGNLQNLDTIGDESLESITVPNVKMDPKDIFTLALSRVFETILKPLLASHLDSVKHLMEENETKSSDAVQSELEEFSISSDSKSISVKAKEVFDLLKKFGDARVELQLHEMSSKSKEISNLKQQRMRLAEKKQAACEWLSEDLHNWTIAVNDSSLDRMKTQGLLRADTQTRVESIRTLGLVTNQFQQGMIRFQDWFSTVFGPLTGKLCQAFEAAGTTRNQAQTLKELLNERYQWLQDSSEKSRQITALLEGMQLLEFSRDIADHETPESLKTTFNFCGDLVHSFCNSFNQAQMFDDAVGQARTNSENLHKMANETSQHLQQLQTKAHKAGLEFLAFAPNLVNAVNELNPLLAGLHRSLGELQPLSSTNRVLEELCQICKKHDSLQESLTRASNLHDSLEQFSAHLKSLSLALPDIKSGLDQITAMQENPTQFGDIVYTADQESSATAARILDLIKPVADLKFQGQWPDLQSLTEALKLGFEDLKGLRLHIASAAQAIQQDQTTALDSKFVASVSESSDKPQNSLSISESRSSRNDSTLTHLIESQVKSLESQSSTQDASSERVRAQNKYKSREQGQSLESRTRIQKDYAKAIMQRFKFKLDGQQRQFKKSPEDFGTDTPQIQILSVREQVDKLISQATSLDNLARMYEGWTPWI